MFSLLQLCRQYGCQAYSIVILLILIFAGEAILEDVPAPYTKHFAVHVDGGHEVATRVARSAGLINRGQIGDLDGHYLFEIPNREKRSALPSHSHHHLLGSHPQVKWFEQQVVRSRRKRDFLRREGMSFNDPLYKEQWYLHHGAFGHNDLNVIPAWQKGYSGKNIVITILDDGIERDHPDLIDNYDPYASYDVNSQDNDPMPRYDPTDENRHGTRCAGEVSAAANNSVCGVGVAFHSKIGGVRMLDGDVYDAVEAASLSFNRSHIDIYSASWGPDDDGRVVDGPGRLAKKAFLDGIEKGRNGKGSIYVWASGNGGSAEDSCNCDGYTNSIYTLSISSTSEHGTKPWYLEECSSTLATTYSSGAYNEKQIVTVDLHKRCTQTHTGTSASAPLAAGIVALALEAQPELTWRDIQYITLMAARPGPMQDGQWKTNGLGRKVSLRYGYGLMDAAKMVELAEKWTTVPEQHICEVTASRKETLLTESSFSDVLTTNACQGTSNEVNYLEHVQVKITLNFYRRGNAVIHITSPSGTHSTLLPRRPNDIQEGRFTDWPFLSVHFWGENPRGTWKLEVEDGGDRRGSQRGKLASWSVVLHGTATQPVNLKNGGTGQTPSPPTPVVTPSTTPTTFRPPSSPPSTPNIHQCHPECAGNCTGPLPENCLECKHFKIVHNGACVNQCGDGYYSDGKLCQVCYSNCKTCRGPTLAECITCQKNLYFVPGQNVCVSECFTGYYATGNFECHKCQDKCKECKGKADFCTRCDVGLISKDGQCTYEVKPLPETTQSLLMAVIIIGIFAISISLLVGGVLYARSNRMLCWSYKYTQLACSDGEDQARLTQNTSEYHDEQDA